MPNDKMASSRAGAPRAVARAVALTALLSLAPVITLADSSGGHSADTRTLHVSLKGLDLSTPDGMQAARHRVYQTAHRLCSQVVDTRSVAYQATYFACIDEALANAIEQLRGSL